MKLNPLALLTIVAAVSAAPLRVKRAVVVLSSTQGSSVSGRVTLWHVEGGIKVAAEFHGLSPGAHGFRIHEGAIVSRDLYP